MIKVTVNNEVNKPYSYPCLGIVKDKGLVVFFYEDKCGTCLDNGITTNKVGDFHKLWCMENFEFPSDLQVTIKNA